MMAKRTACTVHQATIEQQGKQIEELTANLLAITRANGDARDKLDSLHCEIIGIKAALVRAEHRLSAAQRERNALRKTVIVLIETGRFVDPEQPPQKITATFSPDTKHWEINK